MLCDAEYLLRLAQSGSPHLIRSFHRIGFRLAESLRGIPLGGLGPPLADLELRTWTHNIGLSQSVSIDFNPNKEGPQQDNYNTQWVNAPV